ncbi:MAG TPA: hypothetical protein VGI45_27995 [Terracidiphilus sp.]|jgi:hypothetical protein
MHCELVQWADHANCRRCGYALPAPIVNIVERVVEKVVIQQDSECLENLLEASKLISATAAKLQESRVAQELPMHSGPTSGIEPFPTLDAMERAIDCGGLQAVQPEASRSGKSCWASAKPPSIAS